MTNAKIIIGDSRKMAEIEDESIDLVATSPPYWHIKDYEVEQGFAEIQEEINRLKNID